MHDHLAIDPLGKPRNLGTASRGYIAAWVALAALAIAYIATLTTRPDLVAAYLPELRGEATDASGGSRSVDVATMRATINQLNAELAEARTTAATSQARIGVLTSRIAELETRGTPVAAATPPPTPGSTPPTAAAPVSPLAEAPASALARKFAEVKAPAEPRPVAVTTVAVAPAVVAPAVIAKAQPPASVAHAPGHTVPPPAVQSLADDVMRASPGLVDATSGQQIETGSIAAPKSAAAIPPGEPATVSFGPAIVKPAPQPFAVELSKGANVDALRLTWSLLAEQHGTSLKGLAPHYVAASDAVDAQLNLLAGPVKSKAEAIRVCKALQAKGVACKVAPMSGEAL